MVKNGRIRGWLDKRADTKIKDSETYRRLEEAYNLLQRQSEALRKKESERNDYITNLERQVEEITMRMSVAEQRALDAEKRGQQAKKRIEREKEQILHISNIAQEIMFLRLQSGLNKLSPEELASISLNPILARHFKELEEKSFNLEEIIKDLGSNIIPYAVEIAKSLYPVAKKIDKLPIAIYAGNSIGYTSQQFNKLIASIARKENSVPSLIEEKVLGFAKQFLEDHSLQPIKLGDYEVHVKPYKVMNDVSSASIYILSSNSPPREIPIRKYIDRTLSLIESQWNSIMHLIKNRYKLPNANE